MIALTHLVFGLALAYVLDKRLLTASIFALAPDFDALLDFTYPFTQNGIMHSLLAAGVFTFLTYVYTEDRGSAESCLLGYASHLSLDLLISGAPLLFPIASIYSLSLVSPNSLEANSAIITVSVSAMFVKKNWQIFQPMIPFSKSDILSRIGRR